MSTSQSIAILGGGASGLVLARTLADRGFSRVVVFEREATVGGKACTIEIDGRAHDLGATMGVPIDYDRVVALGREGGIATTAFPDEQHVSLATGRPRALNRWHELPRVLVETAKYIALHRRCWDERGLHHADPQLFAPWSDVVARHGLHAANKRMLCYRTGYGYGFDDEVPAVMYASLIRPQTLRGLAAGAPFMWSGGTQPIWTGLAARLAARVEIRTRSAITRIARDATGVSITCGARVERFDRVAITCDPQLLLPVLDVSASERHWFAQVRTYPYATFACEVDGLASGRASVGYCDENMQRERAGHPMAWVKRYADSNLFVFHLFAPPELDDAAILARIAGDVARLGGRLVACRAARRWRFFPHFTSAFMQRGGLADLDAWQGRSNAFLVGEVLSFATMARVTEHAVAMANRIARMPLRAAVTASLAS